MATRTAWVLNLDADLELAAGARYAPRAVLRAAMRPHALRLAGWLLAPGDVLVDESSPLNVASGLPGRAFCPTPRALSLLERAGADAEAHPPVDVLRRVNSRAFASALGPTLPGAAFVTDLEAAHAILERSPGVGPAWRIKHAFGMAGRNQKVVRPASLTDADRAFLRAGLARGGVQIEPDVDIADEYALHGLLGGEGALRLGALVRQRCDARGAWLSTEPIAWEREPLSPLPARMAEEASRVAAALHAAGYFGPFGIDAYTYRAGGDLRLQPRSEVNARYSMGFAVGFGRTGW